jgi:hypothetical protein
LKRTLARVLAGLAKRLWPEIVRHVRPPPDYGSLLSSDWTEVHAQALAAFLKSEVGKAFYRRLQAVAATVAIAGCRNTVHTVHSAGVSAGWDEAVRYIYSISRVAGDQATKPDETPRGETELLEQLSP